MKNAAPEAGGALLDAWCQHNAAIARSDLRALADRTDDLAHRRLAKGVLGS